MKLQNTAIALAIGLSLVGCGDSSSSSSTSSESQTTNITVERGPVLQAVVRDSNGSIGQHIGNGVYSFNNITYPVESFGGYIDMNRNGVVDAGDVEMGQLRLRAQSGEVMTLATTIDANLTQYLLDIGYKPEQLNGKTPSSDISIAALSDEVYKYCYENNITDPAKIDSVQMQTLQNRIQERKHLYESQTQTSAELENELMGNLNVATLTQNDVDNLPNDQLKIMIDSIAVSELSSDQKYTLAYMWNEERLARDLYLALNDSTPSQTLYNIATNAETKHVESVETLIQKYDLNILNTTDFSGGYSAEALAEYEDGNYSLSEITDLYNTLYTKGSISLQDALEVGCMVEVTDINDLNEDIKLVEGVDDIKIVLENLRSGSYSHYWAFDNALKSQGVSNGCCSLGDTYCKTEDEYPNTTNGTGSGYQHGKSN